MQLLPNLENNRPLAIGLFIIAAVLVYFLCFHWFVMRHVEMHRQVNQLEHSAARFKAAVARQGPLEEQLEQLRAERMDSALFLDERNANIAAAGLTRILRELIHEEADDDSLCSIVSTTNQPSRDPERFEQVTVNVRMNCPLPDLTRILYRLENNVPLIFVDNLTIIQRVPAEQVGRRRGAVNYGQLEARFGMYGFLPQQDRG